MLEKARGFILTFKKVATSFLLSQKRFSVGIFLHFFILCHPVGRDILIYTVVRLLFSRDILRNVLYENRNAMAKKIYKSVHDTHAFLSTQKRLFHEKNQEKSVFGFRKLIFIRHTQ